MCIPISGKNIYASGALIEKYLDVQRGALINIHQIRFNLWHKQCNNPVYGGGKVN